MSKQMLSERDIRAKFITLATKEFSRERAWWSPPQCMGHKATSGGAA